MFSHKSCPTLCDTMDPWGPSVHEVLQAKMLEWVAISFSFSKWTVTKHRYSHVSLFCSLPLKKETMSQVIL